MDLGMSRNKQSNSRYQSEDNSKMKGEMRAHRGRKVLASIMAIIIIIGILYILFNLNSTLSMYLHVFSFFF